MTEQNGVSPNSMFSEARERTLSCIWCGSSHSAKIFSLTCALGVALVIQKPHSRGNVAWNATPSTPSCLSEDQTGLGFRICAHLSAQHNRSQELLARFSERNRSLLWTKLVEDCEVSDWIDWTDCAPSCEGTARDVDWWPHRDQETLVRLSGDEMRPLTCRSNV